MEILKLAKSNKELGEEIMLDEEINKKG